MNYSTPATRSVAFGRTGVTLLDRGEIVAAAPYSVNKLDPIDEARYWEVARFGWIEYAMLPAGAYFPRGIARSYYSKSFILEVR